MSNIYRNIFNAKGLTELWDGEDFNAVIPSRPEEYAQYAEEYDPTGIFGWRYANWGCDGRLYFSDTKEDTIFLQTANATPMFVAKKLSEMLGEEELYHEFSDQSQGNYKIFVLKWKNGEVTDATLSSQIFIEETEDFDYETHKIKLNDRYNGYMVVA
ncbi:MAG: hypothetical protein J6A75_13290 [Lachnospiraceae bacterium]|nr:hypothetical protein [Lachnospiraceae bacterium]